ncbi:MAG: hypothetical protein EBV45_14515, partial [Chloroflexi bacterium]|nr:hypothetical protein [Chloroflexota bacterium]
MRGRSGGFCATTQTRQTGFQTHDLAGELPDRGFGGVHGGVRHLKSSLSSFMKRPLLGASAALAVAGLALTPMPAAMQGAPCKVAQVYTSPTNDKGWSWSHEQSFLSIKKDMPSVDLSIRK